MKRLFSFLTFFVVFLPLPAIALCFPWDIAGECILRDEREEFGQLVTTVSQAMKILKCKGNPCIVGNNLGGDVIDFDQAADVMERANIPVVFKYRCGSACARVAGRLSANGHGCILPSARFDVHKIYKPSEGDYDISYGGLDEIIALHGGLPPSDEILSIPFSEASQFLAVCQFAPKQ